MCIYFVFPLDFVANFQLCLGKKSFYRNVRHTFLDAQDGLLDIPVHNANVVTWCRFLYSVVQDLRFVRIVLMFRLFR